MVKNDIRPYELSLWTLQDGFITVLKPIGVSNRGQIETPKCRIKNDGTQELNFSIPMYYRENGILVENPIWYNVINGSLIVNLRKLKLIFNKGDEGEEIVEFVINNVTETHSDGQLKCEVTAEGLAFQELGKVGYKISLASQDFIDEYNDWAESDRSTEEPKNNINYWCEKIFKNSRWTYSIQMDWSSFDGIIVDDISGSYTILNEEGIEEKITYNGTYQNAPKEIQNAFNKKREETLRRLDRIYEEEYISSWEYIKPEAGRDEALIPAHMEPYKEKLRLVDLEKSNFYNLTQDLAKAFGVYCKYKYYYDTNYHIIGKECIFYNNFLSEKEGKIDIIYPYDTSKIERKIDSADVVTKMFVTPIEDETSASGLITIADVTANKAREDYILNFDYLYSIGTISQEQYDSIADYERTMFLINTELEPLGMQIANLETDLVTYKAQLTLAKEAKILDKEQMEQSTALLNSITNNTGVLWKNLANPYLGTLLESEESGNYYIKISQEGVDVTGKIGYPLNPGEENIFGIRLYYYKKVPGEEGTIKQQLTLYEEGKIENESTEQGTPIYPSSIKINCDENGNISSLSNIKFDEEAVSKRYLVTFSYQPKLHYQNIYDTYAKKFAADEALEKEAEAKIAEIEDKLLKIEEKYNSLLEEKSSKIADFENMMGPALKEGSWQAENYSDYGSKYTQDVTVGETNDSHINFEWDTVAFDEEQLLYYEEGVPQEQKYYPCIDISKILNEIKDNLNDLSFIYYETISGTDAEGKTQTYSKTKQMTIGSEMEYAFIKVEETIKPVLLLLDKNFELTDETKKGFLGIITSTVSEEGVSIQEKKIVGDLTWITNDENSVIVYPRLKVDSLLLKTSEDELVIKTGEKTLKNYYDYSILIRGESYLITLKNKVMLQNGSLNKTFNVAYALSNAALSLYLDALEVSKTNAFPQVSYTLEVSAMNRNFIKYAYQKLNGVVSINDSELKFEDVQGYISELDLDLDNPWEDSITIQNYKTKFEDLFSTIVASTEQMKTNSFAYNNAASAFTSGGALKPSIIQNTINQTDLTYAFQSGNLTIDEINGIWARSDAGVVAMRGGGIFCATETDSNGNWLWNTGIMPSGINASLLTAGQIDTNLIKIYAGDNLRLQLNQDGLFAYNKNAVGDADLEQYVVHNSDGLFLVQPSNLNKPMNKVEISWNGLVLRNNSNVPVFYADDSGNLTITGNITANSGKIGNWDVTSKGLWYNNGTAGLIPESDEKINDSSHVLNGHEKMFWVEHTIDNEKKEFVVTTDGTLYCNDIIARGTIAAGSIIGNTTVGEIDSQLRTISVSNLDGTTFSFTNRNYDGNLIISPRELKFVIHTNALSKEELITPEQAKEFENLEIPSTALEEGYKFFYSLDEKEWEEFPPFKNNENDFIVWKPNHLTFILKSDIMYVGLDKTIDEPHSIIYLKIEKEGRQRIVNSSEDIIYSGIIVEKEEGAEGETEIIKTEEPYIYSDIIQLVSEKVGLGKHVSPIDPPSYTFIEDINKGVSYAPTTKFSTILTGFTLEEAAEGYWLVNGGEEKIDYSLSGTETETETTSTDGSSIISDEETIVVDGTEVEKDDKVGLGDTTLVTEANGISVFLELQENNTILASAVVSSGRIPEGGNIKLTFKIGAATRDCFCFKTKNGSDSISVVMYSSSGNILTSGDLYTELSVEVKYGTKQVNTDDAEVKYYYVWKQDDVALSSISKRILTEIEDPETLENSTEESIEILDSTLAGKPNENFFLQKKIYITAADFELKSIYRCDVFSTFGEAKEEYNLNNKKGEQLEE